MGGIGRSRSSHWAVTIGVARAERACARNKATEAGPAQGWWLKPGFGVTRHRPPKWTLHQPHSSTSLSLPSVVNAPHSAWVAGTWVRPSHSLLRPHLEKDIWTSYLDLEGPVRCDLAYLNRDWSQVSGIAGRFFTIWTTREVQRISRTTGQPAPLEWQRQGGLTSL